MPIKLFFLGAGILILVPKIRPPTESATFNLNPAQVIKVAATLRVYTPQILTNHFLVFALHSTIGWKMLHSIYNCSEKIHNKSISLVHWNRMVLDITWLK